MNMINSAAVPKKKDYLTPYCVWVGAKLQEAEGISINMSILEVKLDINYLFGPEAKALPEFWLY